MQGFYEFFKMSFGQQPDIVQELPYLLTPVVGGDLDQLRNLGFAVQDYAPHFRNTEKAIQVTL